jgi:hypothetical protein
MTEKLEKMRKDIIELATEGFGCEYSEAVERATSFVDHFIDAIIDEYEYRSDQ